MGDPCILIIDDQPEIGQFIGSVAATCGYLSDYVDNVQSFCQQLETLAPSHIVLDLQMPDCDGIEVLRLLAELKCKAKIIIISGFDPKTLESAGLIGRERGLDIIATLVKPVRAHDLRDLLVKSRPSTNLFTRDMVEAALDRNELVLFYQPIIALREFGIVPAGFEALLRWQHPEQGLLGPDKILPIAEQERLIDRVTAQVFDLALKQVVAWEKVGLVGPVAVNVSASNLKASSFADQLDSQCKAAGVPPNRLVIELTETAAMQDSVLAAEILTRLRLKGFWLSIDDFGTGYSSMVQLQRLPFSSLKIDRAFIGECGTSKQARIIAKATIDLAHNLGLKAVAEGVENAEVLDLLREMGCDMAQGYHISRPKPPDEAEAWWRKANAA
jgi:EAL domain-containing protein (putative c-di-GMP-specific phosphodiesterase class I)/ActR/RegA family two-component response regulator